MTTGVSVRGPDEECGSPHWGFPKFSKFLEPNRGYLGKSLGDIWAEPRDIPTKAGIKD